MKKEIKWEYWANPLGGGKEYMDDDGEHDDDEPPPYEEGGGESDTATAVRPVIPTAGGLVPLHTYGSFPANFNFWMMHTNFDLSKSVIDTLKRIPGVETCDVVTRYRTRIGFGKCFSSADVKNAIAKVLVGESPRERAEVLRLDEETKQKVLLLEKQALERYKHWAIYVIPNGEIAFVHSDNEKDYEQRLEILQQSQTLAGGLLLTSYDTKG